MTDIAKIFATDPLDLGDKDVDALVAELRTYRKQFDVGNIRAGNTKKSDTAKAADELTGKIELDLKTLLE